jgi:ABC-2 type transport system permease protein
MTTSEAIRLVAKREVTQRVRERSFLVSTGISMLIIAAIVFLPSVFDDEDAFTIGLTTDVPDVLRTAITEEVVVPEQGRVETRELSGLSAAEDALETEEIDAALIGDEELLVNEEAPPELQVIMQGIVRQIRLQQALQDAGVPASEAEVVLDPQPLAIRALDPPEEGEDSKRAVASIGVLLLYGQIFGYGFWVAMGVVEEKSSRVVEVVLSRIRPAQLLAGKIIGIGVLGLGQLIIIVAVGLTVAVVSGSTEIPPGTGGIIAIIVAWFLLGYGFYACCFGVAGALVSRIDDLQHTTGPMQVLLIGSFLLAIFSGDDPNSTMSMVASYIPPSAPLIMPTRVAAGVVTLPEVLVSVALTLGATVLLIPLAGRVYSRAILRLGKPVKLLEAWRARA